MAKAKGTSFNFGFNVKGAKKAAGGRKSGGTRGKSGGKSNAWRRYTAGGKGGDF